MSKKLSKWNKDEECPRMFGIQDRWSRLVIESKETYRLKKMLNYLEDTNIFREDHEDQCEINERKVNNWVNKWQRKEQLGEEEGNWILCSKT